MIMSKKVLLDVPKPYEEIKLSPPKGKGSVQRLYEKAPLPPREISTVSDYDLFVRVLNKCNNCLKNNNVDFAELFYMEAQPLYRHLDDSEKEEVYPYLIKARDEIIKLRMELVRNLLKRR